MRSTRMAALFHFFSRLHTMKKQQNVNAVRSVEIKIKKTANAVPAVGDIANSKLAAQFARQFYGDDLEIYESFFLILMNTNNRPIAWAKVAQGGISEVGVDIMILAKFVVDSLAKNVILVHNHPSGNLTPSNPDKQLTKRIVDALALLGAKVADHIILSASDYYSFRDNGLIY